MSSSSLLLQRSEGSLEHEVSAVGKNVRTEQVVDRMLRVLHDLRAHSVLLLQVFGVATLFVVDRMNQVPAVSGRRSRSTRCRCRTIHTRSIRTAGHTSQHPRVARQVVLRQLRNDSGHLLKVVAKVADDLRHNTCFISRLHCLQLTVHHSALLLRPVQLRHPRVQLAHVFFRQIPALFGNSNLLGPICLLRTSPLLTIP